jgi:hypothetical protein
MHGGEGMVGVSSFDGRVTALKKTAGFLARNLPTAKRSTDGLQLEGMGHGSFPGFFPTGVFMRPIPHRF